MIPQSISQPILEQLFDEAACPVYVISRSGQIAFCNRALSEWLQLDAGQILGRSVEYHSEPEQGSKSTKAAPATPLTDLCPPPRALAGEDSMGTLSCVDRSGRLVHRRARFVSLSTSTPSSFSSPGAQRSDASADGLPDDRSNGAPTGDGPGQIIAAGPIVVVVGSANLSPAELAQSISTEPEADELHRAIRQFRRERKDHFAVDSLLGTSAAMNKVRAQVRAAAACQANVLIVGPPGSGRKRVAKSIHYQAGGQQPAGLIPLDGKLLTQESLRRALDSVGESSSALHISTLLVADVDALAPEMQTFLLTALDAHRPAVRMLATAAAPSSMDSSPTADEVSAEFSVELWHALSTITIVLPRLVERLDDLPLLAQLFLESANRDSPKQVGGIRKEALDRLALYTWPGELEELQRVMQQAHDACKGTEIGVDELPTVIHHAAQAASLGRQPIEKIVLDEFLARIECELIERAMRQADGNKTEAAELLGMTRARLYRRLEQLGVSGQ
jgi:DNA-binding NtrC family response regulator